MEELVQRLIERLTEAFGVLEALKDANAKFREEINKPDLKPKECVELGRRFTQELEERFKALEAMLAEAQNLAHKLAEQGPAPAPAIKPADLANHFRSVIETIQSEARLPRPGEVAATLKSVDVELKGLIVVEENEPRIVTPTPGGPMDPGQLSTIRMSFGSVPVLRPPEAEQPGEPDH